MERKFDQATRELDKIEDEISVLREELLELERKASLKRKAWRKLRTRLYTTIVYEDEVLQEEDFRREGALAGDDVGIAGGVRGNDIREGVVPLEAPVFDFDLSVVRDLGSQGQTDV